MAIPFGKDTITVYKSHTSHVEKKTTWKATVISGALWRTTRTSQNQDGTGYKGANHTVQAPFVADFKPDIGDFLVLGMEAMPIPDNEPIDQFFKGKTFFKATKVQDNTAFGGALAHFMWGD